MGNLKVFVGSGRRHVRGNFLTPIGRRGRSYRDRELGFVVVKSPEALTKNGILAG